jgi:hypothetical protein
VGDPDGAVRRRAADRAVARGDDLAGLAAQLALGVDAEEWNSVAPMQSRTPG